MQQTAASRSLLKNPRSSCPYQPSLRLSRRGPADTDGIGTEGIWLRKHGPSRKTNAMKDQRKTKKQLESELVELRQRLARLEGEGGTVRISLPTVAEQCRAMFEAFDGLIYLCSQDFRVEFMNDRAIRRIGHDATGQLCYRALHDLDSVCPWCVNERVFRGETVRWELRSPKDKRWYYVVNTPIQRSDGTKSKWSMSLDVTERKQAEEALRQSEARYRGLFEGLPVGLYRTTPAGKIVDANEALVQMLGYPDREALIAVPVADLYVDPEDRRRWQALMAAEGVVHWFEARLRRRDGTIVWVVDTARTVQGMGGETHYEGCVLNITRRKGAEEALQKAKEDLERRIEERTAELVAANDRLRREIEERGRAEKELRFQKTNLENLIDSAPEAIALLNRDDRVVRINREFSRVFGYTAAETVGRPINELIVPSELTAEGNQFYRTLKGGGTIDTETVRRRKDGTLVPVSVLAMLIHGENGRAEICAIYRDITERKEAERQLRRRDSILAALGTAVGRFLRVTPLEETIRELLRELGQAAEVSRVYIFENHLNESGSLITSQRFEWVAPGITSQTENPDIQDFDWRAGGMVRWAEILSRGEAVQGHVQDFPESERRILAPQEIKSVAVVPIFVDQKWWGFIGFDECLEEREWTAAALEALRVAAGTLGALIERKRAEDALRESEATLQAILSASPVGISLVHKRTLAWANKAKYDMMGYEIGCLEGSSVRIFYPTEEEFARVGRELYAPIKGGGVGRAETLMVTADGNRIHCRLQASPLHHSDLSRGVIVAAMDITDLKLAEEALRQSEAKYRTLVEQIPAVTYTAALDEGSSTLYVSPQIEALIGFSQAEYAADPDIWRKQIHPADRERVLDEVHRAHEGGEALRTEYRMLNRMGELIWVRDDAVIVRDDSGRPLFLQGIMFDVTARKVAEEKVHLYQTQLRTLASELLFTEERERRRLAIDLHDSIGQALAISKLKLDALRTAVLSSPLAFDLEEICGLLDGTIQQTRSLTFELSPPVLYELGLVPALESLVEEVERRYNLRVHFLEDSRPKPVSEDLAVLLFRAVQELLVNVVKHANAQKVRVTIVRDGDCIRIRVEDNGIGFDPAEIDSHEGRARRFGLFSIRERLHHLGGHVEIESSPGRGTLVSLTAPLRQSKNRKR
ncbi:MAG: sensor signal transduction histidine kinase [Deltaproteobacteria bacterium]|nr:sensor signal transduction histidine kinase [Deltaproteobacteria bacterium]